MSDESVIKDKIIWWFLKLRSLENVDPILEFFVYWFCFDAYITYYSQEFQDHKKLEWFFVNDTPLKTSYSDGFRSKQEALEILANHYVEDMRPQHNPDPIQTTVDSSLEKIIIVIYRIRCNLFHGSKDLNDPKDMMLVKGSLMFMKGWIDWHMAKRQ